MVDNPENTSQELNEDASLTTQGTNQEPGENLIKALESERKSRRELEKQLKQLQKNFEGVDPEKYQSLLTQEKQRQLTEAETKKEFEKTAQLQREEIAELQSKILESNQSYQELQKRSLLQRAYFRSQGKDTSDPLTGGSYFQVFYQQFGDRFQLEDDGSFTVLNEHGKPAYDTKNGTNVTVDDYMNTIKKDEFYGRMFEAEPMRSGTGTSVSGNGGGASRPSFEEKMGWKQ